MCIYITVDFQHFKVFVQSIAKTLGKLSDNELNTSDVDLILSWVHKGLILLFGISEYQKRTLIDLYVQ